MKTDFRPNNVPAERVMLGNALHSEEAAQVVATIPQEHFTTEKHRTVHQAIKNCLNHGDSVDFLTMRESLLKAGKWDDSGDEKSHLVTQDFLAELLEQAAPGQINSYQRLLEEACRQRDLMRNAQKIVDQTSERFLTGAELNEVEDTWQQNAFEVSAKQAENKGLEHITAALAAAMENIGARHSGAMAPYGVTTGFDKFDRYTTGFHGGELIVPAGRPGMGKTSFGLSVALNAVKQAPVVFFSLEMSKEQIAQRLLARKANVNLLAVRSGSGLQKYQFDALVTAMGDLADCSLFIDDSETLTPSQVKFRVRQLSVRSKTPVGLVVIDYLQLMASGYKYESREREISSISRQMKQIAKSLSVPVVLLSQLNRENEKRADKRPVLADLRESGAIEQDADLVAGLYLPFKYTNNDADQEKAELLILKQRNGPIGSIDLKWTPETATFWNS